MIVSIHHVEQSIWKIKHSKWINESARNQELFLRIKELISCVSTYGSKSGLLAKDDIIDILKGS